MDNLTQHPQAGEGQGYLGMPLAPQPKLLFPHLGSYISFNGFKSDLERVTQIIWTFSKTKGFYKSLEFWTDCDHCFFISDLRTGLVETISPRKQIVIGFDTYYINKFGQAVREQLISSQGDVVFQGVS